MSWAMLASVVEGVQVLLAAAVVFALLEFLRENREEALARVRSSGPLPGIHLRDAENPGETLCGGPRSTSDRHEFTPERELVALLESPRGRERFCVRCWRIRWGL